MRPGRHCLTKSVHKGHLSMIVKKKLDSGGVVGPDHVLVLFHIKGQPQTRIDTWYLKQQKPTPNNGKSLGAQQHQYKMRENVS